MSASKSTESNVKLPQLNVKADFLGVILDINPYAWSQQSTDPNDKIPPLKKALDHLRIFLNAHIAQQSGNGVAIWAAAIGKA